MSLFGQLPRESFKEILEEILGGNLECGSAQPSLFYNNSLAQIELIGVIAEVRPKKSHPLIRFGLRN